MTLAITNILKVDPVPYIITQIMASNIGGTATLIGDPPNIMIGSAAKLSFVDFILNTGMMAGVSLIFVVYTEESYLLQTNQLQRLCS